ncbi:hypothetical protein [Burkholderia gladioli]|uniref:hypothetical protein n=1 Tax=Burkholderia gladioli TaxID=28095 RepID=UPI00164225E3|nr:hypothetical protein [Burkholderia gladioli]
MDEQDSKNLETSIANTLAHQVAIAATLSIAVRLHPRGRELLDSYERELLASSIWQLGNSNAPSSFGEKYRAQISEIFSRARANAGFN